MDASARHLRPTRPPGRQQGPGETPLALTGYLPPATRTRLTRRSPGSGFIAAGHLPAADLGVQLTAACEPPKRLKSAKAAAVLPAARLHRWAASRYSPGCSASSARFS